MSDQYTPSIPAPADEEKENLSPLFTGVPASSGAPDSKPELGSKVLSDPRPDWIEDDPNQLVFEDLGDCTSSLQVSVPPSSKIEVPLLFQPTAPVVRDAWNAPDVRVSASDETGHAPRVHAESENATGASLVTHQDTHQEPEAIEWESASVSIGNIEPTEAEADLALEDNELKAELAQIPQKLAFKIGEVADLVGVKQYVLRYWETEFDVLKPKKSRFNQRMYTRKDVEILLMIKKLLYKDRFSTEGARRALRGLRKKVREDKQWDGVRQRMSLARERLEELIEDVRRMKLGFE